MEQREQIKDGVKQKLIEFMAEQITKEESFADLKSEIVKELFVKKEIKTPVVESAKKENLTTFDFVTAKSDSILEEKKKQQADFFKKIVDVKLGNHTNKNIINVIKEMKGGDSTSYSDVIELLENKKPFDYSESFTDSRLKINFTEKKKEEFRTLSLAAIKNIFSNPASERINMFEVKSTSDGDNYYKIYSVEDKQNNFKFECSYVFNYETRQKFINKLYVDSKGFMVMNEELGIPFAIEAMSIIDREESIKQEIIGFINKKQPKKTTLKRPQVRGKRKSS